MAAITRAGFGEVLRQLPEGKFITLQSRLDRGGSLQARKLSTGVIQLYWRYSHEGATSREPIGPYDSTSPPKKLEPTSKGYSIAAAIERCREFGERHVAKAHVGGFSQVKAEERREHLARKAEEVDRAERTLEKLVCTYVEYLKAQGRRSHVDAKGIFDLHVVGAWPERAAAPAAELSPDHVLDMLRRLIEQGKGRTANKLRSYLRAAFQCALDVRTTASIPIAFKAFNISFNPAAQTKRDSKFDRADKRPLSAEEMRRYWTLLKCVEGQPGAILRLHLLTGGQRIEQFVRLKRDDVTKEAITIFDAKGRPGQDPRPHSIPLLLTARESLEQLPRTGVYVVSTTKGAKPISTTTLANWAKEIVGSGIPGFQLKRIRSGVETLLASRGVSREVRGHLQSHGQSGVQARHYDGHDYMPEKRKALEILLETLEREPV